MVSNNSDKNCRRSCAHNKLLTDRRTVLLDGPSGVKFSVLNGNVLTLQTPVFNPTSQKIHKNYQMDGMNPRGTKCILILTKIVYGRVKNIVGKGENAGYQHFLLFPQCFPKPSSLRSLKVKIVW